MNEELRQAVDSVNETAQDVKCAAQDLRTVIESLDQENVELRVDIEILRDLVVKYGMMSPEELDQEINHIKESKK